MDKYGMGNLVELTFIQHKAYKFSRFYYICIVANIYSHVAEWLGMGLQNPLRRFESALDIKSILSFGSLK